MAPEQVDIEVVAYGHGVAFLKEDGPDAGDIQKLESPNVHFIACGNAMKKAHLETPDMIPGAQIVLGVKRPSALDQRLHTSFAYQLIFEVTCPVLTCIVHRDPVHGLRSTMLRNFRAALAARNHDRKRIKQVGSQRISLQIISLRVVSWLLIFHKKIRICGIWHFS